MTEPFQYPAIAHVRRHGPAGYAGYESCRPWLRDEFAFRCVYCLWRETWGKTRGAFHIDHRTAVSVEPDRVTEYDNLIYACASCNLAKLAVAIPDPLSAMVADAISVEADVEIDAVGTITTRSSEAERIVELLDLNSDEEIETRAQFIQLIALLAESRPETYRKWMGFPTDLPDLSRYGPPNNTRPDGVTQSHFARKQRGELPETY